jgi:hypothetical protein
MYRKYIFIIKSLLPLKEETKFGKITRQHSSILNLKQTAVPDDRRLGRFPEMCQLTWMAVDN